MIIQRFLSGSSNMLLSQNSATAYSMRNCLVLFDALQCALLSYGGRVKDEHVTFLINAGLLTRQLIDPNLYWFSIPNIGSILKGLSQGRKELLSFLNRRKYKEMLLAPLEKKRLRLSPLDMRFHLRDLIGSGHLRTVQTPTGLLVRVSKD
ncbi:Non-specific serine/threonine protein kinase protein [Dioscorea alata]|uniref:Non-specific serine/threonine protein kinase protein n=1 Tax=Dioscorea alata TaxID=55571 RepID=A0ACB7WRW8_DIOAL|nr:Non-specific serine/threonine protein kinase protein [Dioscorea alata]